MGSGTGALLKGKHRSQELEQVAQVHVVRTEEPAQRPSESTLGIERRRGSNGTF